MSSRNKRSAESEVISHKKKPRKGDDDTFEEDEEDSASEVNDDELKALDPRNVITTGRRTRGIRIDYTKVAVTEDLDDDNGSETEAKGPKVREEAINNPRTRSPVRKQVTNIEEGDEGEKEDEGGEDEGEEDGQDEDLSDEDGDDDDDDEA